MTGYITSDGDRWDLLAHRFYGNAYMYELIIRGNPGVELLPVLAGGVRLNIPEAGTAARARGAKLPPWKEA